MKRNGLAVNTWHANLFNCERLRCWGTRPARAMPAVPARRVTVAAVGIAVALLLGLAFVSAGVRLTVHSSTAAGSKVDATTRLLKTRRRSLKREHAPRIPMVQAAPAHMAPPVSASVPAAQALPASGGAGVVATASSASKSGAERIKGGCIITKWSAVWLVDAARKTRSHVAYPTTACDIHASEVDDIDRYQKAYGGEGAYSLTEAESALACETAGCFQTAEKADPRIPGASAHGEDALAPPPNGWGMGVAPGWQARSALRFNAAAQQEFAGARNHSVGEPLLLVFGGASVSEMLKNWALHARELGMMYAVACMDEKLFNTANEHGIPGVMMKANTAADGAVTTRWKYYRMDPMAFMQMGVLKVRFFMEFMRAGFDLLCSDLDVVWLRDPRPWMTGKAEGAMLLPFADVVVSTDVVAGANEFDEAGWGLFGELNTGIILFRSTLGSMALCDEWVRRMQHEMVHKPPPSGGFLQWWSNDQTFFNEVVHRAQQMTKLGNGLKANLESQRNAAAEMTRSATAVGSQRRAMLDIAIGEISRLSQARLAPVRNVQFKRLTCRGCKGLQTVLSIATLPYLHFASGHTFFTQSLQERRGFMPVCVHTTFQFGDTAEFTWGKQSRLREKRLWRVDDDGYYRRQSPGTHPAEATYEGFLEITGRLFDVSAPLMRTEASDSLKVEGAERFVTRSLSDATHEALNGMRVGNPNRHLILDAFQRRLVHAAFALGRALRRKVIMPKVECWCDRYWNPLVNCRMPGVSAEQLPLPFHCPFDHVFDLEKWVHSPVPFREYSFLNNTRVSPADRQDVVRLRVRGASDGEEPNPAGGAGAGGERVVTMSPGDNYDAVASTIKKSGWGSAYVVSLSARSLELLCEDLGSPAKNREFNEIMHTVLGVAEQVRFCDDAENPTYGIGPHAHDEWRNPLNCTWGFHRPPKLPEAGEAKCLTDVSEIRRARLQQPLRVWQNHDRTARRQAWSTNDRPAYLQGKNQ